MNETRVSRLLRDARMTASRPERPDTARELVRVGSGRLAGVSASTAANVSSGGASSADVLTKACARLGSPGTVESQMTTLAVVDKELRLCQGGDAAADALNRCVELLHSSEPRVNLRAACVLVKWGDGPMLSTAVRALAAHSKEGRVNDLRSDGAFDALVHRLKSATSSALVNDGLSVLRFASSAEGSAIMQHFVTIGVLPVLNQLAVQFSDHPEIMVHAATLLRNFSVDYSHHMHKVGSLSVICGLFDRCLASKEVISLASRAAAKLVYDDACLAWFVDNVTEMRPLCTAAATYVGSKMIASRLVGTALTRVVEESPALRSMIAQEMPQFLQQVVQTLKSFEKKSSGAASSDDNEVVLGLLRFVAAVTLDADAGRQLVVLATDVVVDIVQDKDLDTARDIVLNCLFTLSNLSFYYTLVSEEEAERIANLTGPLVAAVLFSGDVEACVEATRFVGNLTATGAGANWAERNRLDEVCLLYVGHEDPRIVYNSFGALLNLSARPGARIFADADLCRQLLEQTGKRHTTTEDSSADDVEIAEVVEKVLLNLTNHF